MMKKQLIKGADGRYREQYVSLGPSKALPNHGLTSRRVTGQPVGTRMRPRGGDSR